MKNLPQIALIISLFIVLTVLTQIGGIVYLLSLGLYKLLNLKLRFVKAILFIVTYLFFTFFIIPVLAPFFGREKVNYSGNIRPTNYMTVLLNRNYVRPELNELLNQTAKHLANTNIKIHYLDANFPFINKFPLLPHLSHNDGKKIDLINIRN